VTELDAAAKGFEEQSMALLATVSRWHLGRARGGDEGRALVASAESWMTAQGVANAARMAGALAPGFRR
jgi:ribosomal protein L4